jgi:RHS repeat-associated protein
MKIFFLLLGFLAYQSVSSQTDILGAAPAQPGSTEYYEVMWEQNPHSASNIYWSVSGGTIISSSINPTYTVWCVVEWDTDPQTEGSISVYEDLYGMQDYLVTMSGGSYTPMMIPETQNVAYGATPYILSIEFSLQPSSVTYQWEVWNDGSQSWNTLSGEIYSTYQPPQVFANTKYRCIVDADGNAYFLETNIYITMFMSSSIVLTPPATNVNYNTLPPITSWNATGGLCYPNQIIYTWEYSVEDGPWFIVGTGSTFPSSAPTIIGKTKIRRRVQCGSQELISNELEILPTYITGDFENRNYVREITVVKKGIVSWYQADAQVVGDKFQSTTYLDGLGRSVQSVTKGVSTAPNNTWKDIVKHFEYDEGGRTVKDFLPYATYSNAGKFKTDAATAQQAYILAFYNEPSTPPAPTYTYYGYDESPLNRVLRTTRPGKSWEGTNISVAENFNQGIEKVHIWTLTYTNGALPISNAGLIYNTGTLLKNTGTDEKGNKFISYTDLTGNVILKKVQEANTPGIEHAGWVCTYYVYDDFGRLQFVISPKAVAYLDGNGWNLTQTLVDELCYRYQYDERGRMIVKKQPGIAEAKVIYDKKDRVILTQHANQDKTHNTSLTKSQWSFILYDDLDRTIATGILDNDATHSTLKGNIDNGNYLLPSQTISAFVGSGNQSILADYPVAGSTASSSYLPGTSNIIFNSVMNYDNYDATSNKYLGLKPFNTTYSLAYSTSDPNIEPTVKTNRTIGMLTGEKIRVLDNDNINSTDKFLFSTVYYDEQGRLLETLTDNINMNNGSGVDYAVEQYNFNGKLVSSYSSHKQNPSAVISTIKMKKEFDKIGRLITLYKNFNNTFDKKLAAYSYDELGRLKTRRLAPDYPSANSQLEMLTYDYNIQGWTTGINKDYVLSNNNYSQWDRYFGMFIGYDNPNSLFTTHQFNGNITGQIWKSQGDNTPRKFDFEYDNLNRFTKANFKQRKKPSDASWLNSEVDFTTTMEYEDQNGNIKSMKHMGVIPGVNNGILVDDLRYSYLPTAISNLNGNQLKQVEDQSALAANNQGLLGDFVDGNATQDYWYDKNGNLIKDLNKNIKNASANNDGIVYNFLNKPDKIKIDLKSTIEFTYDASGQKLKKKITYADNSIRYTVYMGDYIYEQYVPIGGGGDGEQLSFVLHEEGRLKIITPHVPATTPPSGNDYEVTGSISWSGTKHGVFEYFVKDNLGSTRMVLTEEVQKEYYVATFENGVQSSEALLFGQVTITPPNPPSPAANNELVHTFLENGNGTPGTTVWPGNYTDVVKLTATASDKVLGPNMVLKVMAGDVINANAKYYYINNNATGGGNLGNTIGTAFVNSLFGAHSTTLGKNQSLAISNNLTNPSGEFATNFLTHNNAVGTSPKAYLNIAFFDEQFKFIDKDQIVPATGSNYARVSSNNDPNAVLTLLQKAPKNGWVYIYLTNESNEIVYFDNLAITQQHSQIAEENHYYPYGLKINSISSRSFKKLPNKFNYQGGSAEGEEETGWDEFDLRTYDPQVGRWIAADPLDEFQSPYTGMGNNPISNIDPSGGSVLSDIFKGSLASRTVQGALLGALIGGGIGIFTHDEQKVYKFMLWGAIIGGVGTYVGSSPSFINVQFVPNWDQVKIDAKKKHGLFNTAYFGAKIRSILNEIVSLGKIVTITGDSFVSGEKYDDAAGVEQTSRGTLTSKLVDYFKNHPNAKSVANAFTEFHSADMGYCNNSGADQFCGIKQYFTPNSVFLYGNCSQEDKTDATSAVLNGATVIGSYSYQLDLPFALIGRLSGNPILGNQGGLLVANPATALDEDFLRHRVSQYGLTVYNGRAISNIRFTGRITYRKINEATARKMNDIYLKLGDNVLKNIISLLLRKY